MTAASKLEHALAHAAAGFHVFRLAAESKRPAETGWPTKATRDPEAIRGEWSRFPSHNIGIATGPSSTLVLDVDCKPGRDGEASLRALEREHGALPRTRTQTTASGTGKHLIFRVPEPVRNSVGKLGAGLDVRSRGGLIVAAGSTIGGKAYTTDDAPIADAPDWLISLCGRAPEKPTIGNPLPLVHADRARDRATQYLTNDAPRGEAGARNDTGYRVACRVKDLGADQAACLALMAEHWRCEPALDPDELAHVVSSAYTYGRDRPGAAAPEADFEPVAPAPGSTAKARQLRTAKDIDPAAILKPDYLVKGWLDRGSNAVLFGEWNAGKTFVALHLAVHIAAGLPWFGQRVRQAGVLYLAYEGARGIDKRVTALQRQCATLEWDRLPFAWQMLRYPLTTKPGRADLDASIHAFAGTFGAVPGLVIVDPLKDALGGDDSDAALMGELNETVLAVMLTHKCSVLRLHHSGHGDKNRSRGHSSLPASADTEIRVAEGTITGTKQRDDGKGQLHFRLAVVELGKDSDGDPVTTCVVEQRNIGAERDFGLEKSRLKAGGNAAKALQILGRLIGEKDAGPTAGGIFSDGRTTVPEHVWKEEFSAQNQKLTHSGIRMAFSRASAELVRGNWVEIVNGNAGLL